MLYIGDGERTTNTVVACGCILGEYCLELREHGLCILRPGDTGDLLVGLLPFVQAAGSPLTTVPHAHGAARLSPIPAQLSPHRASDDNANAPAAASAARGGSTTALRANATAVTTKSAV